MTLEVWGLSFFGLLRFGAVVGLGFGVSGVGLLNFRGLGLRLCGICEFGLSSGLLVFRISVCARFHEDYYVT